MQQCGLPRSARANDRDALSPGDVQGRNREPEIGMRELKFQTGDGDHSFLSNTVLLTRLCRETFKPVIFHDPSTGSILSSAAYSLTRRWMCPQCSTIPSTRQVTRSVKPPFPPPSTGSVFRTLTESTRAVAPPCSRMMRPCLIFRYRSASKSPFTL